MLKISLATIHNAVTQELCTRHKEFLLLKATRVRSFKINTY